MCICVRVRAYKTTNLSLLNINVTIGIVLFTVNKTNTNCILSQFFVLCLYLVSRFRNCVQSYCNIYTDNLELYVYRYMYIETLVVYQYQCYFYVYLRKTMNKVACFVVVLFYIDKLTCFTVCYWSRFRSTAFGWHKRL